VSSAAPSISGTELVESGVGPYVSDTPSDRFPIYTRGNAGEVYPEVFYPLTYSLTRAPTQHAMNRAAMVSGILTENDLAEQTAVGRGATDVAVLTGVFRGYAYLNLSISRVMAGRAFGASIDDVDHQFMGAIGQAPPHRSHPLDRNLGATAASVRWIISTLRLTELPQLVADQQRVASWKAGLPDCNTATNHELLTATRDSQEFLYELFETHLVVSGRSAIPLGVMTKICTEQLDDPTLPVRLFGGVGDVSSAAPAIALWSLGRRVAGDVELTELFDQGTFGLSDRLALADTAAGFRDAFADFLREFGSRGPNEWETACDTWGTDPDLALTLVDRLRNADPANAPATTHKAMAAERKAAIEDARSSLRGPNRWVFDRALASGTLLSRSRERTKTTVVDAIHEMRLMSRELGRRLADQAGSGNPDDLWFLLEDELDQYLATPERFAETIGERRHTRAELARRVPPFFFDGRQPSADTWAQRNEKNASATMVVPGEVITGIGGCPGVARGRARIVTDPADPGELGPGDVLIAPLTDPAWTPLFLSAKAVVVDVGAQLSHAVIVSRELGIPCAVSVTDATNRIPDDALIEVDGTRGTVTIIELP